MNRNLPGSLMSLRVPGKSTPLAILQCVHPSFSHVSMFMHISEWVPSVLGLMTKELPWEKATSAAQTLPSLCVSSCLCKKKKEVHIIFLWALRFILFCRQTFGNAFYKLYWDKISRDVCICLSSAQYYFLMHFWLCRQRIQGGNAKQQQLGLLIYLYFAFPFSKQRKASCSNEIN